MRDIVIDKVTINMGVGSAGEPLEKAKSLLKRITNKTVVETKAKVRNPTFKIKPGDKIGVKVTLRGSDAEEFLKKAFDAVDFKIKESSIDREGNFSFGIAEYIDFPGAKYDPNIGIMGFDVCVSLKRRGGARVSRRRRGAAKIGKKHRIAKEETIEFLKKYNIQVI